MALNNLQEYHLPEDNNTVVELLGKHQDGAMIIAGGTFIHGLIARGLVTDVEALIDVSRLGLNYVKSDSGNLKLGATTKFIELQASDEIMNNAVYGAIKDALEYPPTQVKNSATIGGCVSASCPFFDLPTSFLALNTVVTAQGGKGTREIPLGDFFSGLFENVLEQDEFMTELSVPASDNKAASAFIKLETNANDLAILNAATYVEVDGSGKCNTARVYIGGGVGETPERSASAEGVLTGQVLSEELCADAGQAAQGDVDPLSDHRASAEYRKAMTKVLVERALKQTLSRLS